MLTVKQHELLCFIDDKLKETGVSPSFEEMKDALGLKSKSGIHRLTLEERDFIRRLPNRARALEVLKLPEGGNVRTRPAKVIDIGAETAHPTPIKELPVAANDIIEIPLHGKIAAGMPIEAIEGQTALSVPAALLGAGEHFALEVSGDSMIDAGILDGDYALIQRTETARNGEIVGSMKKKQRSNICSKKKAKCASTRQTAPMSRKSTDRMKCVFKEKWPVCCGGGAIIRTDAILDDFRVPGLTRNSG